MCKQTKALFLVLRVRQTDVKKAAGQKVLKEQIAFLHRPDKQNAKIYEKYSWFTKLFRKRGSLASFRRHRIYDSIVENRLIEILLNRNR